jgi:site-specific DNA-methyltransferase (adenine-specific)
MEYKRFVRESPRLFAVNLGRETADGADRRGHWEEIFKMKFDVIVGNPPYQMGDGGLGTSAAPLYHKFIQQAKKMNPRFLAMVVPSRWFTGGKGLDDFRKKMLNDKRIRKLIDYAKSRECFYGVDIAGGVRYFLWYRDNQGDCELISITGGAVNRRIRQLDKFDILIRDNIGIDIIHKVIEKAESNFSDIVLSRNSFGFTTSARGKNNPFDGCIKLISSDGESYVSRAAVTKNVDKVDNFKISIGTLNPDRGGVNNASDGKMNVTTKIRILQPNEVVTETYIIINSFKDADKAKNCAIYFKTKFSRFLISLTITSMHIVRENFRFVPLQDFSKSWTDEKLYAKYWLTQEEIAFIESMIRPMEVGG